MQTLIVFESMFGNTEAFARDIADGLASTGARVAVADVRKVRPDYFRNCDLLVVGASRTRSPSAAPAPVRTRCGRGPSRTGPTSVPASGSPVSTGWSPRTTGRRSRRSTAGSTRYDDCRARPLARPPGCCVARASSWSSRPTSFFVLDVKGPAATGERARARGWGVQLGRAMTESMVG